MRLRCLATGEEYDGDWLDLLAVLVFWGSFAVVFAILFPFAVAVDVRNALAEIDAVKAETEP